METFNVESADLSKGDTPRSTHVTITGIVCEPNTSSSSGKNFRHDDTRPLHSITPASWRPASLSSIS